MFSAGQAGSILSVLLEVATAWETEPGREEPTAAEPDRWPVWLVGNMNRRLQHHKTAERASEPSRAGGYDPTALYENVRAVLTNPTKASLLRAAAASRSRSRPHPPPYPQQELQFLSDLGAILLLDWSRTDWGASAPGFRKKLVQLVSSKNAPMRETFEQWRLKCVSFLRLLDEHDDSLAEVRGLGRA